jgi:hypothetical protein
MAEGTSSPIPPNAKVIVSAGMKDPVEIVPLAPGRVDSVSA